MIDGENVSAIAVPVVAFCLILVGTVSYQKGRNSMKEIAIHRDLAEYQLDKVTGDIEFHWTGVSRDDMERHIAWLKEGKSTETVTNGTSGTYYFSTK